MAEHSKEVIREFQNQYSRFKPMLGEAQEVILDSAVSEYPVFVFSKTLPELGVQLYESRDVDRDWYVHATSLEELVAKNVIDSSRVEDFKEVYKDPSAYFCILLLDGSTAQFAFPPIKGIPFSEN